MSRTTSTIVCKNLVADSISSSRSASPAKVIVSAAVSGTPATYTLDASQGAFDYEVIVPDRDAATTINLPDDAPAGSRVTVLIFDTATTGAVNLQMGAASTGIARVSVNGGAGFSGLTGTAGQHFEAGAQNADGAVIKAVRVSPTVWYFHAVGTTAGTWSFA